MAELFLINSVLPDRSTIEDEFINIELEYEFTTLSRLKKLLKYLKRVRHLKLKPILMFIRNENEDVQEIYKYSKKLLKMDFAEIIEKYNKEENYWYKHSDFGV